MTGLRNVAEGSILVQSQDFIGIADIIGIYKSIGALISGKKIRSVIGRPGIMRKVK